MPSRARNRINLEALIIQLRRLYWYRFSIHLDLNEPDTAAPGGWAHQALQDGLSIEEITSQYKKRNHYHDTHQWPVSSRIWNQIIDRQLTRPNQERHQLL